MRNTVSNVVVLNDFHPSELPGAATEALNSAIAIASNPTLSVKFFSGGQSRNKYYADGVIFEQIKRWPLQNFLLRKSNRLIGVRFLKFAVSQLNLIRIVPIVVLNRHSVFLLHSLGAFFPFSTVVLLAAFRIKILLVHNDLTCLSRGKLYPIHFPETESIKTAQVISKETINLQMQDFSIRRLLRKIVCNSLTTQAALSRMQNDVLCANGFNCKYNLLQTIKVCSCDASNETFYRSANIKIRILFIGRPIGKGFDDLVELVRSSNQLHIVAIGSNSLLQTLKESLPKSRFDFLGRLSPSQVFSTIHKCDVVWARSTYFDVGPLTILEALAHGVPVVCTPLTGNSDHAWRVMPSLVKPLSFVASEKYICSVVDEWFFAMNMLKAKEYVASLPRDGYLSFVLESKKI